MQHPDRCWPSLSKNKKSSRCTKMLPRIRRRHERRNTITITKTIIRLLPITVIMELVTITMGFTTTTIHPIIRKTITVVVGRTSSTVHSRAITAMAIGITTDIKTTEETTMPITTTVTGITTETTIPVEDGITTMILEEEEVEEEDIGVARTIITVTREGTTEEGTTATVTEAEVATTSVARGAETTTTIAIAGDSTIFSVNKTIFKLFITEFLRVNVLCLCRLSLAARFVQDKERSHQSRVNEGRDDGFVVDVVSDGSKSRGNDQADSSDQLGHGPNAPKGKAGQDLGGTQNQKEGLSRKPNRIDKGGGYRFERRVDRSNAESLSRIVQSREDGADGREGLDDGLCFGHGEIEVVIKQSNDRIKNNDRGVLVLFDCDEWGQLQKSSPRLRRGTRSSSFYRRRSAK